jgi:hypothetical protein
VRRGRATQRAIYPEIRPERWKAPTIRSFGFRSFAGEWWWVGLDTYDGYAAWVVSVSRAWLANNRSSVCGLWPRSADIRFTCEVDHRWICRYGHTETTTLVLAAAWDLLCQAWLLVVRFGSMGHYVALRDHRRRCFGCKFEMV